MCFGISWIGIIHSVKMAYITQGNEGTNKLIKHWYDTDAYNALYIDGQ